MVLIVGGAALGLAGTVAAHRAPGPWLGGCLVVSTVLAALAVRPSAIYRLIPLPPLAYVLAAAAAGVAGTPGPGAAGSRATLAVLGAQWLASGFVAMTAASTLAVVLAVTRTLRWRRRLSPSATVGEFPG